MVNTLRMAELLCTRLCHDLTGPIGAVNNGAEFLSEDKSGLQGQAVELIVSSAFSAVTRLQFYRTAYGKVKEQGEANLADKQKLAMDFFSDSKITLDWPDTHADSAGVSISLKMSRLIFNLLIVASTALIRGGTIAVRIEQEGSNRKVTISSKGPGLKWDADMEKPLAGKLTDNDIDPKNVQYFLTRCLVDELGAVLTCKASEEELVLQVTQPV
jgi:histidine phosphotransferase ChpT